MIKASYWIEYDGGAMRIIEGSDPEVITNRLAFIEKTPRVRIRPSYLSNGKYPDFLNWAERPWKGMGLLIQNPDGGVIQCLNCYVLNFPIRKLNETYLLH